MAAGGKSEAASREYGNVQSSRSEDGANRRAADSAGSARNQDRLSAQVSHGPCDNYQLAPVSPRVGTAKASVGGGLAHFPARCARDGKAVVERGRNSE